MKGHVIFNKRLAIVPQSLRFRAPHAEPSPLVESPGARRSGADAEVDPGHTGERPRVLCIRPRRRELAAVGS